MLRLALRGLRPLTTEHPIRGLGKRPYDDSAMIRSAERRLRSQADSYSIKNQFRHHQWSGRMSKGIFPMCALIDPSQSPAALNHVSALGCSFLTRSDSFDSTVNTHSQCGYPTRRSSIKDKFRAKSIGMANSQSILDRVGPRRFRLLLLLDLLIHHFLDPSIGLVNHAGQPWLHGFDAFGSHRRHLS